MFNKDMKLQRLFKIQSNMDELIKYTNSKISFESFFKDNELSIINMTRSKMTDVFQNHMYIFDQYKVMGIDFIERYIKYREDDLSEEDKNDLRRLKDSYQSIFYVSKVDKENCTMEVIDQILGKEMTVVMEEFDIEYFERGEHLYTRIAPIGNMYFFSTPSITMPKSEASQAINIILKEEKLEKNVIDRHDKYTEEERIYQYLRQFSHITLFRVLGTIDYVSEIERIRGDSYLESIREVFEWESFTEIKELYLGHFEEFMDYLLERVSESYEDYYRHTLEEFLYETFGKNKSNLLFFQEADIYKLIEQHCEDGVFLSFYMVEELIDALDYYFEFMSEKNYDFSKSIESLEKVKEDIFILKNKLNSQHLNLINEDLARRLYDEFDYNFPGVIGQCRKYFMGLINVEYKLTPAKKQTSAETIRELSNLMGSLRLSETDQYKQSDFPIIDYLFAMAKANEFVTIDELNVFPSSRGLRFFTLSNDELASFVYLDLFNITTISEFLGISNEDAIVVSSQLKNVMIELYENRSIDLYSKYKNTVIEKYIQIFSLFGLTKFTPESDEEFELSLFGEILAVKLIEMNRGSRILALS